MKTLNTIKRAKAKKLSHLKALRVSKGLTLVEVAKGTGISTAYVSQLERGVAMPTIRVVAILSKFYGEDFKEVSQDFLA